MTDLNAQPDYTNRFFPPALAPTVIPAARLRSLMSSS